MRFTRLAFTFYLILLFAACSTIQARDQEPVTAYGLEISSGAGIFIIVKVNDVPFKPKKAGTTGVLSIPINGEVIPGENEVEVLIGTGQIMPDADKIIMIPALPDDSLLTVDLQKDIAHEPSPGVYETRVESLITNVWEPKLTGGKAAFPQKLTFSFNAPANHTSPVWLGAEKRDVSEIQHLLVQAYRDIVTKLQAGDTESIGDMRKPAYRDAAKAYPLGGNEEERLERGVSQIARLLSRPNMVVPNILEPLECKAYADSRLFECFAADGKPVVRLQSPDRDPIYFKFRFSVLDSKLSIVR